MGKRSNEEITQQPDEQLENVGQEVVEENETVSAQDGGIICMVSQVKDGETKLADTLDDGWEADGVAIVDGGGETLLVVALGESELAFGGDESEDLEEDVASPGMTSMDGEMRSAFLLDFYGREEKAVPALDACTAFGWLPSGGEMALIFAHKEAVNAKLTEIGGTPISDGKYWTSQRFSNERMWHCDMSNGQFGIALGTKSVAGVRAVKK